MPIFADFSQRPSPFDQQDNPFQPRKRRTTALQELNTVRPEAAAQEPLHDAGLLGTIGNYSLSGLSRIGNLLDVPGSMVRDTLGGHNPFDQLLPWNLTTSEHRTSGRDLLRQHGLVGEDNTYGNWWGGLGAEIALEPLTFVGGLGLLTKAGGFLTKSGKAARALGLLEHVPALAAARTAEAASAAGTAARTFGRRETLLTSGIGDILHHLEKTAPEAATAAREAAKEAGIDLAAHANQPLGSAATAWFPSLGEHNIGTGPWAQSTAHALDVAGKAIAESAPGRMGSALFDATKGGFVDPLWQGIAAAFHPAREAGRKYVDKLRADWVLPMEQLTQDFAQHFPEAAQWRPHTAPLTKPAIGATHAEILAADPRLQREMIEKVFGRIHYFIAEHGMSMDDALKFHGLDPQKMPSAIRQQIESHIGEMQKIQDEAARLGIKLGLNYEKMGEGLEHAYRYMTPEGRAAAGGSRVFKTSTGSMIHRREAIGHVPEPIVNDIATDPLTRVPKMKDQAAQAAAAAKTLGYITQRYGSFLGKGGVWDDGLKKVRDWAGVGEHAEAILKWAEDHPLRPVFPDTYAANWLQGLSSLQQAVTSGKVVHALAKEHMTPFDVAFELGAKAKNAPEATRVRTATEQLVQDALDAGKAGPLPPGADIRVAPRTGFTEHRISVRDFFTNARMNPETALKELAEQTGRSVADLEKMTVPHEVSRATEAMMNFNTQKDWQSVLLDWLGKATKPFTRGVTLPFAAFASRNLGTGQYVWGTSGLIPTLQHAYRYGQKVIEAGAMLMNGKIDDAIAKEIAEHNVFQPQRLFEDVAAGPYSRPTSVLPSNPLDIRETWQQAGQSVEEAPRIGEHLLSMLGKNPADEIAGGAATAKSFADRIPRLLGLRKGYETALGTGAKVNQWIEFLNRVPGYLYLRGEGWTAEAAAKKVKELQIDYHPASFSPMENQYLRGRLVPFYSWSRKMAPVILDQLLHSPAGLMGQTIRASRLASGGDASTPEYVTQGLTLPNPFKTPETGGQSFIGGMGLPHEQFAQFFTGPRGIGRELLSQSNPLLKGPLEWITGQSLFQNGPGGVGRSLDDLDPAIGRTLSNLAGRFDPTITKPVNLPDWLEHAAVNSPASRFITTARQLTDPRKSAVDHLLNTFTGAHVIDVSPAARDATLRAKGQEMMKDLDASQYQDVYFSKDQLAAMNPAQRAQAERLIGLQRALVKRSKERLKAKKSLAAQ